MAEEFKHGCSGCGTPWKPSSTPRLSVTVLKIVSDAPDDFEPLGDFVYCGKCADNAAKAFLAAAVATTQRN